MAEGTASRAVMKKERSVSPDEFREALGNFASGITVVVSRDKKNQLHGITVSAFCSVSLEPPLVLVCIDKTAGSHESLEKGSAFIVNILAEDQERLSEKFASLDEGKFVGINSEKGIDDIPIFADALAVLECRVVDSHSHGDHSIFVGSVLRTHVNHGKPLVHHKGTYGKFR